MSDIERRLHHAARELRSVEIELPPLGPLAELHPSSHRRSGLTGRVPALVMPVLFVLGGLAVLTGGLGRTADPPTALPSAPAATVPAPVDDGEAAPTAAAAAGEAHTVAPPAAARAAGGATGVVGDRRPLTARQEVSLIAGLTPAPLARPAASPAGQLRTVAQTYH